MRPSMQRIVPADELVCHQTPETFATVSHADISWTEKIWGSLFARDGSLQVDCGLGKYHNRNLIDMFAGISRGREQLTVRASRQLDADPERTGVGPFDYEVLEPLKKVRFVLRENHLRVDGHRRAPALRAHPRDVLPVGLATRGTRPRVGRPWLG